jgi:hypothetical protein
MGLLSADRCDTGHQRAEERGHAGHRERGEKQTEDDVPCCAVPRERRPVIEDEHRRERVTSTPAGINVAVGSSGSASFATGTTITLRATNSRDVIWSGACSSGGNKVKTCTFTLNANAAVTANVQ